MSSTQVVKIALGILFLVAAGAAVGEAALITWTVQPTTTTSVNQIDQWATLFHAGNWGTSASQSVTVGGETILFADRPINGFDGLAGLTSATNGEYQDTAVFSGDTGDLAFNNVLDGFGYDGANPKVVTLGGLNVGYEHQVQLFVSDDRGCCGGRTQKFSDNPVSGSGNETSVFSHNQSVFVIGRFIADSPTQNIYAFGVNQSQNIVNGYVLRGIVPEPTTLLIWSLLAGLGVGLGWRRRRH